MPTHRAGAARGALWGGRTGPYVTDGLLSERFDYIRIQCATPTCVREVTRVKDRDDREDDDDDVNEDDDVRDDDDDGGGERRRERRRARCTQQGSTRERAW